MIEALSKSLNFKIRYNLDQTSTAEEAPFSYIYSFKLMELHKYKEECDWLLGLPVLNIQDFVDYPLSDPIFFNF